MRYKPVAICDALRRSLRNAADFSTVLHIVSHLEPTMLNDHDHIEAIYLVARHGREAPQIAGAQGAMAADRGDSEAVRRWRTIRRFIQRNIAEPETITIRAR